MRRFLVPAVSFVASVILTVGCRSSTPNMAAQAAVGTGMAIAAAAINRAASGSSRPACWGSCRPGMVCDHASGECVPMQERPRRPPPEEEDDAGAGEPTVETSAAACRGLCVTGEICVLRGGVSDCVLVDGGAQ